MARVFLVIIDGLGIGAQEDAKLYGDENADTLGNVCRIAKPKLPNFEAFGLGNIRKLDNVKSTQDPKAHYGKMRELSAGKDSTTGHWELAGIHMEQPFPTYPEGFPQEVVNKFCKGVGVDGVLCNKPYSGTAVIEKYGGEHLQTGKPILYTSADSVFQVASHEKVTPVDELHKWCKFARDNVMRGEHGVGRVIARPFTGEAGNFERISDKRQDFSLIPPKPNLLSELESTGVKRYSIGKIIDLFADKGFTQYRKTKSNAEGISQILSLMSAGIDNSFTFANLIDTDQIYGHRQNPEGYGRCLEEIDRSLPAMIEKLGENDVLIFTGDHGNDPADDSTDHTREFVPLLVYAKSASQPGDLGVRETFSDVASTILDIFGVENRLPGESFKDKLI